MNDDRNPYNGGRHGNGGRRNNVAELPYINFRRDVQVPPEVLARFIRRMRYHVKGKYQSRLDLIFSEAANDAGYPEIPEPDDPRQLEDAFQIQLEIKRWEISQKRWGDKIDRLEADKQLLAGFILGRIGPDSHARIRSTALGYEAIEDGDPLEIINALRVSHSQTGTLSAAHNCSTALEAFYKVCQNSHESLDMYLERFQAAIRAIFDSNRAMVGPSTEVVIPINADVVEAVRLRTEHSEHHEAALTQGIPILAVQIEIFVKGMNRDYYLFIQSFLDRTLGRMPETLQEAVERAANSRTVTQNVQRVYFAGRGRNTGGGRGRPGERTNRDGRGRGRTAHSRIRCYRCNRMGHYASNCTENVNVVNGTNEVNLN